MSSGNLPQEGDTSPKHRTQGYIQQSHRTNSFKAERQKESAPKSTKEEPSPAAASDPPTTEAGIIQKLDQKRLQLDAMIAQYISERQKEYDSYEQELYGTLQETLNERATGISVDGSADDSREIARGRSLKKPDKLLLPLSREIWAGHSPQDSPNRPKYKMGNRTPTNEREKEFHDLFTPFFLPLLDAGSSHRSNSLPPVPVSAGGDEGHVSEGYQSDSARQQMRRSATEPGAKPTLSKKSALRSPKKTTRDRKKRVSLVIDDEIVSPSESPKETRLSPTTVEETPLELPAAALADAEGSPIIVLVPEKARMPYPNEDALDYVMAVGGTMHHAADLQTADGLLATAQSHSLTPAGSGTAEIEDGPQSNPPVSIHKAEMMEDGPNDAMFEMSPETTRNAELGQLTASPNAASPSSPIPTKQQPSPTPIRDTVAQLRQIPRTISPPRSPTSPISQQSRHPSYISKFSTSANRIFGNLGDEILQRSEAAFVDDDGPSTTYVGGLSGSGVDDVDIGSAGYPSSVGASYLEQFAAARGMAQRAKERDEEDEKGRRSGERKKRKEKKKGATSNGAAAAAATATTAATSSTTVRGGSSNNGRTDSFDDEELLGEMEGV